MKRQRIWAVAWAGAVAVATLAAEPMGPVSAPQGLMVSVYDSGYALCTETRTFTLARGLNTVDIEDVLPRLNPASVALVHPGRGTAPDLVACGWVRDEPAGARQDVRSWLRCRLNSEEDGPIRLRLMYSAEGFSWRANYVLLMREGEESTGLLSVRAALENESGRDLREARVRFVETERGGFVAGHLAGGDQRGSEGLRYLYGELEPQPERFAASPAYARVFEAPRRVDVANGATTHVTLFERDKIPVSRFYVYDGVKLDRFEKNPRHDWNYGTAYQPLVDSYLELGPLASGNEPVGLPRGRLMAVLLRSDDTADVLGYGLVQPAGGGDIVRVQMGPARGLRGTRERVSYTEITPFREYEESFLIRLENESAEDVEVRVVEHLYRWPVYEIVKADTEHTATAPQTIEFRPVVKANGIREVNYTVRYRW